MDTKPLKKLSAGFADPTKCQLKFQFSHCEFMTLYALLADATSRQSPPYDMYAKLLHNIMVGIYKKFCFEGIEIKNSYTIELSSVECLAFWLYWTDHDYSEGTPAGKVLDRLTTIILLMFTPDPHAN